MAKKTRLDFQNICSVPYMLKNINYVLLNKNRKLIFILMAIILVPTKLFAQEEAEQKLWKSSVGLSYVTVSGNSSAETLSVSANAIRQEEDNKLDLKAETIYAKSNGQETSKYWKLGGKYDQDINEDWYWFGLAALEGNKLAGYNSRLNLNPGVGHHFLKGTHELNGEIGPGYFFEDRIGEKNISSASGRAYVLYKYNVSEKTYFSQDAEYLHVFTSSDAYRVTTETALVVKFSDLISLKAGVTIKYVNKPPLGKEDTDVFTSTSLVFNF